MSFAGKLALGAILGIAAVPAAGQISDSSDSSQIHWLRDEQSGCRAPDPDFTEGDGIVWSGTCPDGVVTGQGSLTFLNKDQPQVTISGTFRDGNLETGHGSLAWPDGSRYDGDQVGGKFEGKGVFVSAQQDRLEGEWKDGVLNGHATVQWANGNRYEGEWANGKAEGHGAETWANGDRYDGEWHDGKAQGRGVQVWANGQSYDGEWRNDQPNGTGKLTRPDGTIFQGTFVDGHPQGDLKTADKPPAAPQVAASATPTSAPTAKALPAAAAASDQPPLHATGLNELDGKKLVAVDGSSIALASSEGGFTRVITKPDGATTTTAFVFVNDRMGTVADASNPAHVTGLFKMTNSQIDVDYSDGHSEAIKPGVGGVALALRSPDGTNYCMEWYPEGHVFSEAERKAALAAYASKLGLPLKGTYAKAALHPNACNMPAAPTLSPAATLRPAALESQSVPHPLPRPIQASFEMSLPASKVAQAASQQPIMVRPSQVHLIDTPKPVYNSAAGGQASASPASVAPPLAASPLAASLPAAPAPAPAPSSAPVSLASIAPTTAPVPSGPYQQDTNDPGASSCLAVASDGTHWGFKNSCNYTVQFAYCLKGDAEPLAACKVGSIGGSAAPQSFSALVADAGMKDKSVDHQFRWVACGGGAGEVVPKLDGTDPPVGRCLRARTAEK